MTRFALGSLLVLACSVSSAREPSDPVQTRSFTLDYQVTVQDAPIGSQVRLWMPIPPSSNQQSGTIDRQILPTKASIATEPKFGNRILFCEFRVADDRDIIATMRCDVKRRKARR